MVPVPPNWFGDLWNVIVGTSGVSTGADVGLAPPVSSGPYAPPTSQPTTPYSPGMQLPAPVNTALGWLANSTARAGATLGIAANPASKDFLSLSSAWRDAVNVSPGQALAALPGTSPLTTGRDLGTKYGVNTGVAGGIDPTDPAVRKAAFESGGVGELTSWTGDAIFQYYANPQVLGGQALRPLFRYAQGTKVLGPEELAAARTSTAELVAAKTQGPEAVKVLSSRQRGLSDFLDNVRDNPGLATYHPLAAKSTNPNLVVGVLSSPAVTEEERVAAVLSGWGDTVSAQWLETRAPDVKTALDNANAALTDAEKVSKAPIPLYDPVTGKVTMNDYITDPAELVKARADVEALKARSAWYRAATGGNDEPGIYQAMRGHSLSPFQPVNIARTRMAGTRAARTAPQTGYWAEQKLSPLGETGPMVRFVAWMGGGAPKGYIAVNGAAAFDSHLDVIAGMQKAGMTPAFIDSHLKDYVAQNTANGRELVAARIDKDTIRAMFLNKLGHDAAQAEIDNTTKYVDDFMSAYQAKRQNVLEQARNEKGYIHDIESNQSTHVQALEPQQPQIIPMTDYVLVQRALNEMGQGEWDRVRGGLFKTGQGALDKLAPLWKANVLLRIGAMPRNNGESWLATWTFLGRFAGSPLSGSANIVANRADAVIARYVDKQGRVNVPGIEANLSTKDAVSTLQHNVNQLEQHRAMLLQAKETNQAFLDSAVTPEQWRTEVAQRASTEATAAYPRGPVLFHGTGTRFTEDQLAPSGFQDSGAGNLFGFGFYTTDSAEVAAGYTTKGGATNPAVYSVHWNGITAPKMLDLDAAAPSDLQNMFREWSARLEIDDHIRAALAGSPSTGELIRALRSDLAESGVTRAEADEYLGDVASWVQSSGYDGLRHAGGLFRGASKTTTMFTSSSTTANSQSHPMFLCNHHCWTVTSPAAAWSMLQPTCRQLIRTLLPWMRASRSSARTCRPSPNLLRSVCAAPPAAASSTRRQVSRSRARAWASKARSWKPTSPPSRPTRSSPPVSTAGHTLPAPTPGS